MTVQEATKIAQEYCAKKNPSRKAVYGGTYNGGLLFRLSFQGTGHHGTPLFVIIQPNGDVKNLEKHSVEFNNAWHISNDYLEALGRL